MRQPREFRDWFGIGTLIIGVFTGTRTGGAETLITAPDAVIVRAYTTGITAAPFAAAHEQAAVILRAAGITVRWVDCNLMTAEARCARPPNGNELILRVVWVGSSPRHRNMPLGEALIDMREKAGSLATVYADRVTALAHTAGVDPADVMARAIAHELGHLLLGTNQHTEHGLMRPVWSGSDLRRNQAGDWRFSGDEATAMQRGVIGRAFGQ